MLNEKKPIRNMPIPQIMLAREASLRGHKKKSNAEKNTTKKPGSSLGSSRTLLWILVSLKVSFKKLLIVESIAL